MICLFKYLNSIIFAIFNKKKMESRSRAAKMLTMAKTNNLAGTAAAAIIAGNVENSVVSNDSTSSVAEIIEGEEVATSCNNLVELEISQAHSNRFTKSLAMAYEEFGRDLDDSSYHDDNNNLDTLPDDALLNLAEQIEENINHSATLGPETIHSEQNKEVIQQEYNHKLVQSNDELSELENNIEVVVAEDNIDVPVDVPVVNKKRLPKKRENVKKRSRKPHTWKINVRRELCQSGKEYTSVRGKTVLSKKVKNRKDCLNRCKFSCAKKVGDTDRQSLFNFYYSLTQNEKYLFIQGSTEKYMKGRKTVEPSRRAFSFRYYFKIREEKIRVCKQFFLGTLSISQKPIYTAHSAFDTTSPKKSMRGKTGTRKIKEEVKKRVMDHIMRFPVVESHYCRANTKKKYLESTLSISRMYDLYLIDCAEDNIQNTVKLSMYRYIFNNNFNYAFHKPKKDVCEKCSKYYLHKKENNVSEEEENKMKDHLSEKMAMREEKNKDRTSITPVLCFDLENVITCPRSFVGNHFYLQKLTLYNLTAYLSTTKRVYCAIWIETMQGRTGNCLASAFKKIVERVLQDNNIEHLVTWSDSCVPQNRNSFISFSVLTLLRENPNLKSITMKYSVPGHGAVQEVDCVHSQIERYMALKEFFSPLSFIRELKNVNQKNPFVIIQMRDEDFKNFEECASKLDYNKIPFSKVTAMRFKSTDIGCVEYKLHHTEDDFTHKATIYNNVPRLSRKTKAKSVKIDSNPISLQTLIPKTLQKRKDISKDKIDALKKMTGTMPEYDKNYYKEIFKM